MTVPAPPVPDRAASDGRRSSADQRRISPARRMWHTLLEFLEIVGLRSERREDQEASLARFRLYHTEFRKLLSANNALLEIIADLERKASSQEYFDTSTVRRSAVRAVTSVHAMVGSLAVISGDRYPALGDALGAITGALNAVVARPAEGDAVVLDLPVTYASHADLVGGKMANLGEVRNAVGLPTPDGFTVTTHGFHTLLDGTGLASTVIEPYVPGQGDDGGRTFPSPQSAVLAAAVPDRLAREILGAYDRLVARCGEPVAVAVRSSAIGEDGSRSFAGQFLTELNVGRDGLVAAYRRVVASLYSPEATHYRRLHGIPPESAVMAVGVVAMVDAATAGVVFSREPADPTSGNVLIQAVRGLGVTLVEGLTTPEAIVVAGGDEGAVVSRVAGQQTTILTCRSGDGVVEQSLGDRDTPATGLAQVQTARLARWARTLEAHFACPQDTEWAVDGSGRIWLLQSRPLRVVAAAHAPVEPHPGAAVLLAGGDTAYPGVGCGTAVLVDDDYDLDGFPEGGVLVARRPSPRFVRAMSRARAIVTDVGSTTGHMASLARELGVPTLLATRDATAVIAGGQLVTVDSAARFVYAGEVTGLAAVAIGPSPPLLPGAWTPEMQLLQRAAELIVPLSLTDPRSPTFAAEHCRTLHDIARFVHERSYEEMFRMGAGLGDLRPSSHYLDVFLPIDLYIIDLGGGLAAGRPGGKVKPSEVLSVPLAALLRGMLDKRIPRYGPRGMDLGGFVSVMMRHALSNPEEDRTFRDPCYALVSDCYLNYTARVGYHFGVVDSYCSGTANKNYISMQFKGGAADRVRRARRVRAIAGVLRQQGFSVRTEQDLVTARLSKPSLDEATEQLEMLGRLLQFFRQMDAAMTSDEASDAVRDAFLAGDLDAGRRPSGDD